MTDVMKTCANCGNTQETGEFCEKCGTRFANETAEGAKADDSAAQQAQPAPGTYTPGAYPPGAYPQGAYPPYGYGPQAQYAPPREPGAWDKLFDLSFQGFLTPASMKVLYFITLGLIGAFTVFSIIWGFLWRNGGLGAMWLFVTLAIAAFLFFWTRILFELVATTLRVRDNTEKKPEGDS